MWSGHGHQESEASRGAAPLQPGPVAGSKVRLDYLAPAQVEEAFRSCLALPPPGAVANLAGLTPGDFTVVHWTAEVLAKLGDPEALAGNASTSSCRP